MSELICAAIALIFGAGCGYFCCWLSDKQETKKARETGIKETAEKVLSDLKEKVENVADSNEKDNTLRDALRRAKVGKR